MAYTLLLVGLLALGPAVYGLSHALRWVAQEFRAMRPQGPTVEHRLAALERRCHFQFKLLLLFGTALIGLPALLWCFAGDIGLPLGRGAVQVKELQVERLTFTHEGKNRIVLQSTRFETQPDENEQEWLGYHDGLFVRYHPDRYRGGQPDEELRVEISPVRIEVYRQRTEPLIFPDRRAWLPQRATMGRWVRNGQSPRVGLPNFGFSVQETVKQNER